MTVGSGFLLRDDFLQVHNLGREQSSCMALSLASIDVDIKLCYARYICIVCNHFIAFSITAVWTPSSTVVHRSPFTVNKIHLTVLNTLNCVFLYTFIQVGCLLSQF